MSLKEAKRLLGYKLGSVLPADRLRVLAGYGLLGKVLLQLGINCVVDVGANVGQYGTVLRGIGYKGWILSFEPVKASFDILASVAKRHGPWRVFHYALGAANGQSEINVNMLSVFSSFLTPHEDSQVDFPANRVERREDVEVRRLDDVLATCLSGIESPRLYLKMDTQGFDLEVVRGAESVLASVLALQTEVSFRNIYVGMPGFLESLRELRALGFDVVDFLPVTAEMDGLCAVEMDCIMARRTRDYPH